MTTYSGRMDGGKGQSFSSSSCCFSQPGPTRKRGGPAPGQRTGDDPLAPRLPHNPFVSVLIAPAQEDEGDEEEEEEEAQHGQIVSAPSSSARGRKEEEEENRRSSFSSPGPCCKGSHSMCAVCIVVLSKRGPRTRSPMYVRHRVELFRALPPCCATPGSKFGLHSPRL